MTSSDTDDEIFDEHLFDGVRFFLVGFEGKAASQVQQYYRSEMIRLGGADAGPSVNGCTHVVVSNLLYDDPTCVAARAEGKKVVSEQWVKDSLDGGVLADADRVIYWPVRHLNGIPGAQSLLICLTGYQRNYREYITKMVSLMGAQFSKPLVANVVTHLICYKFEGEKYVVAKKMNIKLVNHRWLEDCLKAWEILPVDDYCGRSSWELELMEAQANDSEDEAEAAGPMSLNNRSSVRCTLKANVFATIQSPPGCITKTEDANSKTHDVTGQGSPNLFGLSDKRDNSVVRSRNSPNLQETEEKYAGARTQDLANGVLGTPGSSKISAFSNHRLDTLNENPGSQNGHTDHVSGRSPVIHDQIDVTKVLLASPLRGNQSVDELDSSKVDRWRHQKDGASGIDITLACQSNADAKITNHESIAKPGDSKSNSIKNASNSKKTSRKSLLAGGHSVNHMASPKRAEESCNSKKTSRKSLLAGGHSVNNMASPKSAEESTLRADSNISSLQMGHQKVSERADIKSMKGSENIEYVDRPNDAYAQKTKSLVSPASLDLQKEDPVSETGPLGSPFVSWQSDASDVETNTVHFAKQQSSLSTSRQTRSRKTSLKHGSPINGIKLPESSSRDKNVKSLSKARMSLKAMAQNKRTTSLSPTVQDGKTGSGFSIQNKDREDTQGSGNAVNQDCLNVRANDLAHDKSVHNSSNSQVISSSGNCGIKITDPLKVYDNDVAMVSNSDLEKVVCNANAKGSTTTPRNVQGETSYSKKLGTPIGRNAGAKRPRSASIEVEGSAINSGKKVLPESSPAEVIPYELADPASKNGCSLASAADLKTNPPKKALISGVTDTVAKRTRNACAKIDSSLEFSKMISQENIETNSNKFFDIENADKLQRNSPKKIPNTRVRNSAAKRSRTPDTNTSNETLVDKTETVAVGSLFDDLFPSDNVEDCPKKLSSCASASDCETITPKAVSNTRIRNAVAKRKIKTLDDKSGRKCGKVGSAIASVAKAVSSRTEEISCNISKVTADRDSKKSNKDLIRDVSGLSCQDSGTVNKQEGPGNSKLRSSKRNKVPTSDHGKENRLDCSDLNSKSNRTASLRSKSDAKPIEESTQVLSEHQMVEGNESGTLIVTEPALFILSGNREQRKDYRSIIRRLKGRVCRDSHHWSYQATHLIAPDPLRRTEKFLAAAAAGRWILKGEYLTSCNEAGKFVGEEPFEWFGTGLNDGETISFEAPRKWRNIRQQMGHGAFYGMQIVVYGQLILPTLDTVKRAVKAGDGTILATLPPYTRFLDSGVDFAVVSASIPRADTWVQEFIRHSIPCVTVDYLVEYVCKPGHPLGRHVLFKTDDLANKSLEKLKKQQEMATEKTEQSEDDDDPEDLSCSVCGLKDRGEVMLICGDENGESGCGIGMHIDCCDPPLDAVPDADWLCPKCAVPRAKTKPTRGTERKARGSRRR